MSADNLTLQVLAAPVLVLSTSPLLLQNSGAQCMFLYPWDQSHHLYFYYWKVKEKMELSEFVLLKFGVSHGVDFWSKI